MCSANEEYELYITIPVTIPFSDLHLERGPDGVPVYDMNTMLKIANESGYSAEQMNAWPPVVRAVIIRCWIRILDAADIPLFDDVDDCYMLIDELVTHEYSFWHGPKYSINMRLNKQRHTLH
jgi:hypothetical protein